MGEPNSTSSITVAQSLSEALEPEIDPDGSAWFLGTDRTVHYCYEVSSTFGIGNSELEGLLQGAIEQWVSYIDVKDVNGQRPEELRLATQFQLDLSCAASTDLHFIFGNVLGGEHEVFKYMFVEPLGFAVKTSVIAEGWGRGLIWIAEPGSITYNTFYTYGPFPNWVDTFRLRAVLLHEIGHVLGNEHAQATIMDSRLFDLLALPTSNFLQRKLGQIDQESELVTLDPSQSEWHSGPNFDELGVMWTPAYHILLGEPLQTSPAFNEIPFTLSLKNLNLSLMGNTPLVYSLVPISTTVVHQGDTGIFQARRGIQTWSSRSLSQVQLFDMVSPSGLNLRLLMELNVPGIDLEKTANSRQVHLKVFTESSASSLNGTSCTMVSVPTRSSQICSTDDR